MIPGGNWDTESTHLQLFADNLTHTMQILFKLISLLVFSVSLLAIPCPLSSKEELLGRRGSGGAYFLVEPGELQVQLFLWSNGSFTERNDTQVLLLSPDRSVVAETVIPVHEKSSLRHTKPVILKTKVSRPGVYALFVYTLNQRSGGGISWGIQTNAPHWMIDNGGTQGPDMYPSIALFNPGQPADIWFRPPVDKFTIEVAHHMKGNFESAEVYDQQDQLLHRFDMQDSNPQVHEFTPAPARNNELWRLHVPDQRARINIGLVTKPTSGGESYYPLIPVYTPYKNRFFPIQSHKYMLRPYHNIHYVNGKGQGQTTLTLHNGANEKRTFKITIERDEEVPLNVSLRGNSQRTLEANEECSLIVDWEVMNFFWDKRPEFYVRATPLEDTPYTDYVTVQLRDQSERPSRVQTPIVPQPYRHERALYGYSPNYPTNEFSFDLNNRPLVRDRTTDRHHSNGLWTQNTEGDWILHNWTQALSDRFPDYIDTVDGGALRPASTWVDKDNDFYTVLSIQTGTGTRPVLMHFSQSDQRWHVYPLGGVGRHSFAIETFNGHNQTEFPPAVAIYRETARPERATRYERLNDLLLYVPEKVDGHLKIPDPVLITKRCKGIAAHSGSPRVIASKEGLIHLTWGETVEDISSVPGVPTYVTTYNRQTSELSAPVLVTYAPPVGHLHNCPSLVVDSEGLLHLVAGSHGDQFLYSHSLQLNSTQSGWSEPKPFLFTGYTDEQTGEERGRQTYVGLVVDPQDTLHLVFRQWRRGNEHLQGFPYASLSYQRKRKGQEWEDARELVRSPIPHHSLFYNQISIDRKGILYLSYVYRSSLKFYRSDLPGILNHQAVLTSEDSGSTWGFLTLP